MTASADRVIVERLLRAAIAAADPAPLVRRALARPDVVKPAVFDRAAAVHIVAIGKAAASMAAAASDALGARDVSVRSGLVIVPHGTAAMVPSLQAIFAAHPIPDATSLAAGTRVAGFLAERVADDVVLLLLSGGASALAVQPAAGVSIDDYAGRIRQLMHDGADIRTVNLERRRIDTLKAGGMARLAAPARVIALVLSDVIGDPLDIIASGPLTPDGEPAANADIIVIGNNDVARHGAAALAGSLDFDVIMIDQPLTGDARAAGGDLARHCMAVQRRLDAASRPTCLIAGGETTVTVTGNGRGGRNQELVLAAMLRLDGAPGITIGSVGTDGIDGASPAAGAVVDACATSADHANAALRDNDSFSLLSSAGCTVTTGPTGTNVGDVQIALIRHA